MSELTARLQKCYSGAVFDVLREAGRTDTVIMAGSDPGEAYEQHGKF